MKKKIILIIILIIIIISGIIGYLKIKEKEQIELLSKEIANFSNKDLLKDEYKIKTKTTGDYEYIEKTIKNYYKELSDNTKIIYHYLNNKELINILSLNNLQNNRPKFTESHQLLDTTRTKINDASTSITELCDEEKIKKLVDKEKIDKDNYELYLQLIYTEKNLKTLTETNQEIKDLSTNLNTFLDKIKEVLVLLEQNNSSWEIVDNQIHFMTPELVDQYNNLYNELNKITTDKFNPALNK